MPTSQKWSSRWCLVLALIISITYISVFGSSGSGKSTFINLASGSSFGVGHGIQSCTNAVQVTSGFDLDGRRVVLIDTPGFDDTTLSDSDVLRMIAAFLKALYVEGSQLAGVLYFYRISDPRMGGTSRKDFNLFWRLCGNDALRNITIVTNMWGEVDPQVGSAREAELLRKDIFFGSVFNMGTRMARHDNTFPSAKAIIRHILGNHALPLRIQRELADEQKDISETSAGKELIRELNAKIRKHQEEMRILKEDMRQAIEDGDEEMRRGLELEMEIMQKEIERFQIDSGRQASDYKKEMLEAQLKRDREKARMQAQIDSLSNNTYARGFLERFLGQ